VASPATVSFATSGTHTLRVQVREAGVQFDQIVLSPVTYRDARPGLVTNDNTFVPRPAATQSPPATPASPSPGNGANGVARTATLAWSSAGATSYDVRLGTANPPPQVSAGQSSASYGASALAFGATYFWQIVARNASGSTAGPVWSFTTAPGPNVVVYASDVPASSIHGAWRSASDPASPNGAALVTPYPGNAQTDSPLVSPIDYVDVAFDAAAGTPYTLWLRVKALNDSKFSDSLWAQFSDARANGSSVYSIGSASALLVNLATDGTASSNHGWGWVNGCYWLTQSSTVTFATDGPHTLRLQVRESGVMVDQIVLSPGPFLQTPPGVRTADITIVPKP
jgi:hypothetical protein